MWGAHLRLTVRQRPTSTARQRLLFTIAVATTAAGCGGSPVAEAPAAPLATIVPTTAEPGSARPQAVTATSAPTQLYVVQSGDTLYDIAARFGVSAEDIIELSKLKDPGSLHAGQQLLLPFPTTTTTAAPPPGAPPPSTVPGVTTVPGAPAPPATASPAPPPPSTAPPATTSPAWAPPVTNPPAATPTAAASPAPAPAAPPSTSAG